MQRRVHSQFWYIVVAVPAIVWLRDLWVQRVEKITYNELEQALRDGPVADVGAEAVAAADFVEAVGRIVGGLEKRNGRLNDAERRVVARHEVGRALGALALPGVDPVANAKRLETG